MGAARIIAGLLALAALPGCSGEVARAIFPAPVSGAPIVAAQDSATAGFTLTTCAPTDRRAARVEEVLTMLVAHGTLVQAIQNGNARLNINLCGSGGVADAPAPARRPVP